MNDVGRTLRFRWQTKQKVFCFFLKPRPSFLSQKRYFTVVAVLFFRPVEHTRRFQRFFCISICKPKFTPHFWNISESRLLKFLIILRKLLQSSRFVLKSVATAFKNTSLHVLGAGENPIRNLHGPGVQKSL